MVAAGLKAISTVIESTAVLIKSRNASSLNSSQAELISKLASRFCGVMCECPDPDMESPSELP